MVPGTWLSWAGQNDLEGPEPVEHGGQLLQAELGQVVCRRYGLDRIEAMVGHELLHCMQRVGQVAAGIKGLSCRPEQCEGDCTHLTGLDQLLNSCQV